MNKKLITIMFVLCLTSFTSANWVTPGFTVADPLKYTITDEKGAYEFGGMSYNEAFTNEYLKQNVYYKDSSEKGTSDYPVLVESGNYILTENPEFFILDGEKIDKQDSQAVIDDKNYEITFPEQFGKGTELKYTYKTYSLEGLITIDSLDSLPTPEDKEKATLVYNLTLKAFKINGEKEKNGNLYIKENDSESGAKDLVVYTANTNVWDIRQPLVWDSDGKGSENETLVSVKLVNMSDGYYTELSIPYTWLESAKFPIYFDPSWVQPSSFYTSYVVYYGGGCKDSPQKWYDQSLAIDGDINTAAYESADQTSACHDEWIAYSLAIASNISAINISMSSATGTGNSGILQLYNSSNYAGNFTITIPTTKDWVYVDTTSLTKFQSTLIWYRHPGSGTYDKLLNIYEIYVMKVGGSDGTPCTLDSTCDNGHCIDGVCCDTTCTGFCQRCSGSSPQWTGTNGTCANIPTLQDPDSECTASSNCNNGTCNGAGACGYYNYGEGTCPTCKTCTGASSTTCLNTANHNQDTEGSNTCSATCKECNGAGSCTNQADGSDYFTQCDTPNCGTGNCNGSGVCGYYGSTASGICVSNYYPPDTSTVTSPLTFKCNITTTDTLANTTVDSWNKTGGTPIYVRYNYTVGNGLKAFETTALSNGKYNYSCYACDNVRCGSGGNSTFNISTADTNTIQLNGECESTKGLGFTWSATSEDWVLLNLTKMSSYINGVNMTNVWVDGGSLAYIYSDYELLVSTSYVKTFTMWIGGFDIAYNYTKETSTPDTIIQLENSNFTQPYNIYRVYIKQEENNTLWDYTTPMTYHTITVLCNIYSPNTLNMTSLKLNSMIIITKDTPKFESIMRYPNQVQYRTYQPITSNEEVSIYHLHNNTQVSTLNYILEDYTGSFADSYFIAYSNINGTLKKIWQEQWYNQEAGPLTAQNDTYIQYILNKSGNVRIITWDHIIGDATKTIVITQPITSSWLGTCQTLQADWTSDYATNQVGAVVGSGESGLTSTFKVSNASSATYVLTYQQTATGNTTYSYTLPVKTQPVFLELTANTPLCGNQYFKKLMILTNSSNPIGGAFNPTLPDTMLGASSKTVKSLIAAAFIIIAFLIACKAMDYGTGVIVGAGSYIFFYYINFIPNTSFIPMWFVAIIGLIAVAFKLHERRYG